MDQATANIDIFILALVFCTLGMLWLFLRPK